MNTRPWVFGSRPATIRSALVFPQPDGPTRTTNSPSRISRSSSETARVPSPYTFVRRSSVISAIRSYLTKDRIAIRVEAAAVARPRASRWGNALERQGVLASVLISPAGIFFLALLGGALALAVYLSFTNATAGSLSGKYVGAE